MRHLIENIVNGERQEIEDYDPDLLSPDEVYRGVIPEGMAIGFATWNGSEVVADETQRIEIAWNNIRAVRAPLLLACDWTQLRDCSLSEEKIAEWAAYRQALKDLPVTVDPFDFEWPTPPS